MKQTNFLKSLFLLFALIVGSTNAWGQSDNSATYTSNVTLSTTGGTSASTATVKLSTNGTEYDALKAGTGKVVGAVQITAPAGTKYLHLHAAGWNGETVSIKVTQGSTDITTISLTSDAGISGNTTDFTLSTPANATTSYYKVITFNTPLASNTNYKFTASGSGAKRFVIWGVNAEKEHTLTYSATNGSISGVIYNTSTGVASGASVAEGGKVTLTATPADGYDFSGWNVSGTGATLSSTSTNPTTFTMGTANATVTANFVEQSSFTINAVANDDNYGTVSLLGTTITATPKAGYKVPTTGGYTVTSGTATVVNNGDGTFTVTPTSDCTVQINFVEKATPTFSFASATASATYGGDVTEPNLTKEGTTGAVTYESSNTAVATVDEGTGEVTIVSVGTTIIKATVAEDANYKTKQASYTLTVNENSTASGAISKEVLLDEGFGGCDNTGGNDEFNGNQGTAMTDSTIDSKTDEDVWSTGGYVYPAYQCVRVGSSSNSGSITTDNISLTGSATLTFKAAGWKGDTSFSPSVSGTGCTLTGDTSPSLTASTWDDYTVDVTGATGNITLTFSGKRYFLDAIKLEKTLSTSVVPVTVPSSGWGTFCSPYALDLGNAATTVEAYAVSGYIASAGKITLVKQTGKVPAKTPLVIKGEASSTKKIAVAEGDTSAPDPNILLGYLSPTYYDDSVDPTKTLMGMSSGNFVKITSGTIPANRAVLVMETKDYDDIPDGSKFTFIVEDESETDGIKNHNVNFVKYDGNIYNLAGQKVGKDYKGIVIVNGKKMLNK